MKYILVAYDPKRADNNRAIDMFSYLRNELDNAGIKARISEFTPECDCDDRSWRGGTHDSACAYAGQKR